MAKKDNLPGPCSIRQYMYMYPEEFAKDRDGNKIKVKDINVVLFGGAAGCFDADTEYLTPSGWNKISNYDGGLVGQWDSGTDEISFVRPEEYIKLPQKEFKRIHARGLDFCLSDEHRVPYFNEHNLDKVKVISFEEMLKRHDRSTTKGWAGKIKTTYNVPGEGINLSEGEIRLQIAVQADKVFDKKWWGLSQEQMSWVVDEVRYWDSNIVKTQVGDTVRYSTSVKENADFIQHAFHTQGYNTSLVKGRDNEYTVNATKTGKGFRSFANKDGKVEVEIVPSVDGWKYCFTVPSTFLVVRRNDKIYISGNSGKSEIGVIDFLKHTDIPNFIGVMTRRTTPQLQGPGGLLTKCKRIFSQAYNPEDYTWRAKDGKFVFHKSGAEIYLKHFERDDADDNWQGAEANLYYVDEGTQFTQHMIQYIMSRMRNPSCPQVEPHLRITCNPDADHFLRKWVEPYLTEDGTPDRNKDGWVRYFSFYDGDFIWADTPEELAQEYGIDPKDALSFTFISATVRDNPVVEKINPRYVAFLKGLKGVERARLLDGKQNCRQ